MSRRHRLHRPLATALAAASLLLAAASASAADPFRRGLPQERTTADGLAHEAYRAELLVQLDDAAPLLEPVSLVELGRRVLAAADLSELVGVSLDLEGAVMATRTALPDPSRTLTLEAAGGRRLDGDESPLRAHGSSTGTSIARGIWMPSIDND